MKRYLSLFMMLLMLVGVGQAQNDMRKRFEERRAERRARYDDKRSEQQKRFDEFRRKQNERYVRQLRNKWKKYEVIDEVVETPRKDSVQMRQYQTEILSSELDTKAYSDFSMDVTAPLPTQHDSTQTLTIDTIIVVDTILPRDTMAIPEISAVEIKIEEVLHIPEPAPQPQPMANIEPMEEDVELVSISLYGTLVSVAFPQDADLQLKRVDEDAIASLWEQIADTIVPSRFDVTITSCLQHRADMKLCDWAYLRLVQSISKKRYGDTNEAVIFASYIMAQSGYKIRLAFKDEYVFMLFASHHEIYGMKKVMLEDDCYFILDSRLSGSFYISEVGYEKEQRFSLLITEEQRMDYDASDTLVVTSENGYSMSYQVNKNNIEFLNDYPAGQLFFGDESSKWLIGVKTPLDSITKSTLYPQAQEAIQDLSPWQAVAKLLNWVQTGFQYACDDDVWGYDRVFFPSETLFYPNSDCEDKAILFSTLVREVLNLDVLLLYFENPEHLLTAVHIPVEERPGEFVMYKDKRYMVCDPTLRNGPIGRNMTYYAGATPKIIVID